MQQWFQDKKLIHKYSHWLTWACSSLAVFSSSNTQIYYQIIFYLLKIYQSFVWGWDKRHQNDVINFKLWIYFVKNLSKQCVFFTSFEQVFQLVKFSCSFEACILKVVSFTFLLVCFLSLLGWCPVGSVLPHGEKVPL